MAAHGTSQTNRRQHERSAVGGEPDLSQTYLPCLRLTQPGRAGCESI